MERWKQVRGWEGRYSISTEGRVRNDATGKILKPMRTGNKRKGAQRSKVRFSSTPRVDFDVAHLVLEAFIGSRPEGLQAMHANDDSADNRVENLSWGSIKQNMTDCAKKGRSGNQKIDGETALIIKAMRESGVPGRKIAACFGVSEQRVCDIYKGRSVFTRRERNEERPIVELHGAVAVWQLPTAILAR